MITFEQLQAIAHKHCLTVYQSDPGNRYEYFVRGGGQQIVLYLGKSPTIDCKAAHKLHYYQAHHAKASYPHPFKPGVMVSNFVATGRHGTATSDIEEAITAGLVQEAESPKIEVLQRHDRKMHTIKLFGIQDGQCYYCKKKVPIKQATADHLIPLVRGGKDNRNNLAMCCFECNQEKGDLTAEEFLQRKLQQFSRYLVVP